MVSADTVDLNPDDDSATVITTAISPSADLAINVAGAPDPVNLGQNLTYTITVTNLGPGTAPQVQVTNTLPTGVSFVSASPNRLHSGNLVVFTNLGSIGYPGSASASIVVQPGIVATFDHIATCVSGVSMIRTSSTIRL